VWFVSAILRHQWNADLPHPSLSRMEKRTGVSRRQLHTYQKQLVAAGWLRVISRRTAQGGQDTCSYDFTPLFTTLVTLLERDKPSPEGGHDVAPPPVNWDSQTPGKASSQLKETEQETGTKSFEKNVSKRILNL
jgi:hypothetical protein